MKASQADILIIPGHSNASAHHWQSRWESKLSTARRIEQDDWEKPVAKDWIARIAAEVNAAAKPVVLVAHSLGVAAAAHAAAHFNRPIAGAFFVAPPDLGKPDLLPGDFSSFGAYPRTPLSFPTLTVASRTDPFGSYEHAEEIAQAWGSKLVDAGESGHINSDSGHGPWPEGSMVFAQFLSKLQP